ncbi:MAG: DUF3021 family protein [Clostridiaceae bacterium]|nr:DUF3021 family protein [Kiritimatiellia bacterium]NLO35058.1 DUF3021 family protein [Clostridiaceae bacterium]
MSFRTYLIKKVMMSFFVSVACICAAMALIGLSYESEARFGYEAFLSPLLFGAAASLPLLVKYSRKELSLKQAIIRNIIHFILLEVLLISLLFAAGLITDVSMAVSLGFTIFVIDITVYLVLWISDTRTARAFNKALQEMQKQI